MAIDYGDVRTGIAVSDPTGLLAGFATTIRATGEEALVERVAALAAEHDVAELVVGYPKNMDGSRGPRAEKAEAMAERLRSATGLPVALWDERRTTIDAWRILHANGRNVKKGKARVDAVAASLILEGYLGRKKEREEDAKNL